MDRRLALLTALIAVLPVLAGTADTELTVRLGAGGFLALAALIVLPPSKKELPARVGVITGVTQDVRFQ
jgi:hypothetical protein